MKSNRLLGLLALSIAVAFLLVATPPVFAQARRQPPASDQKKNKRPDQQTEEKQQEPLPPDLAGKPQEAEKITVSTNIVNVDAVVYNKKTGQPSLNLKKDNFAIFVDGVKKDITNFSTPEAPITVTLVIEYSKLGQILGYYGSGVMQAGQNEVIRPTAIFLSQFIKPEDYVSVIAYDMRPTPLTDFTNNPQRIQQVISLLLRNQPPSTDPNLFTVPTLPLTAAKTAALFRETSKGSIR